MKSPEIEKEFELSEPLCEEFIAGGKAPFVTGVVRVSEAVYETETVYLLTGSSPRPQTG